VGARFSKPIQIGPGAHPASCGVDTVAFLGVKWPGHGAYHPPPYSIKDKERVELFLLLSLWAFVACF